MSYIASLIICYFLFEYLQLYLAKARCENIIMGIWQRSEYAYNEDFGAYYVGNAGIFFARYFEPQKFTRKLGYASMYSIVSIVIAGVMAFVDGPINLATILGAVSFVLFSCTSTCRYYSFNITPDLLIQSLTQNYLEYAHKAFANPETMMEYHRRACEITEREAKSYKLGLPFDVLNN